MASHKQQQLDLTSLIQQLSQLNINLNTLAAHLATQAQGNQLASPVIDVTDDIHDSVNKLNISIANGSANTPGSNARSPPAAAVAASVQRSQSSENLLHMKQAPSSSNSFKRNSNNKLAPLSNNRPPSINMSQQQPSSFDQQSEQLVTLNIGGTLFTTVRETLTKTIASNSSSAPSHYFAALLNSKLHVQRDQQGYIFIDRDPTLFRYILNYLRAEGDYDSYAMALPWHSTRLIAELIEEARFYNLVDLVAELRSQREKVFDVMNCSNRLQLLDHETTVTALEDYFWGTVRCKFPLKKSTLEDSITPHLAKYINYYEIVITEANFSNNTSIFIGIANANTVLNKSVGFKNNGYSFFCYNGQKYENDTAQAYAPNNPATKKGDVIGMWLDVSCTPTLGSLYFYRNGVNLGCAFVNIDLTLDWYFAVSLYLKGDTVRLNSDAKHPELK